MGVRKRFVLKVPSKTYLLNLSSSNSFESNCCTSSALLILSESTEKQFASGFGFLLTPLKELMAKAEIFLTGAIFVLFWGLAESTFPLSSDTVNDLDNFKSLLLNVDLSMATCSLTLLILFSWFKCLLYKIATCKPPRMKNGMMKAKIP